MKDLAIIRVPLHYGQPKKGVEFGPDALLDKGLVGKLQSLGVSVATNSEVNIPEFSNDPTEVNLKNPRAVADSNKRISDKVQEEIKAGRQCLILGGDHSLGIGSVHGDAQAGLRPVLLWIDAHADINPPHVSPSGNAHGMPVAFVTEELKPYISKKLTDFCWLKHFISVRDIAYIGLRDIDTGERRIIEDYGIASFSMHEIERHGIANTLQMALCAIDPYGNRPIHVSFDIDSLDPSVAPSTGTPVPGGLTLREGLYLAEELAETGRVRVLDVVELNPKLGSKEDQELTIENTIKVISHFYGNRQRGVYPKNYSVPQP